jgi:beta-xylosidase
LEEFKRKTWHGVSENEVASWRNSMQFMKNVLEDDEIPHDSYISIEYMIPMSSKRVDLIVSGKNNQDKYAAVVIELKQWSQVEKTNKDGIVKTFVGGTVREVSHPSYQAWSYVQLIRDFNLAVQDEFMCLSS